MSGKKEKRGKRGGGKPPKSIGGIKLPKELRAAGGMLLEKANSPLGREVLAAGVTALAAVAARAAPEAPAGRSADLPASATSGEPAMPARQVVDALGVAALAAAGAALTRLMRKDGRG